MYHMGHGGGMEILKNNPIFRSVDLKVMDEFRDHIKCFEKGFVAYNEHQDNHDVMFLLDGQAVVEQVNDDLFLKRLYPGDLVGVLSIFTEKAYYPTKVTFEKPSRALVLNETQLLKLLYKDPTLLKNYMTFFNGQVKYLLSRIALFSLPNGEERLLAYLSQISCEDTYFSLPMSKVELAEYLGLARSTLYRSFDKLIDTNVIEVSELGYKINGGKA